jgi:hypothetical protein
MRASTEGVTFLGFRHMLGKDGRVYRRLHGESLSRARRRMRRLRRAVDRGAASGEDVRASVLAWLAHVAHGDCRKLAAVLLQDWSG